MKTKSNILFLLIIIFGGLSSCVDTVSIDAEDESLLVINCELTKGNPKVIAHLTTSNNLNGTQPITNPADAIIEISLGSETPLNLFYNPDEGHYDNGTKSLDWSQVVKFELNANIPGSIYPNVSSRVNVGKPNTINNILANDQTIITFEGKDYYQRVVTLTLDTPRELPAYYELILTEKLTTSSIVDGERVLVEQGEAFDIDNIEVLTGGAGILPMEHRCGVLIDQSRLIDNELSFVITSPHPIQSENQVFSKINTILGAISKPHYDYHRAKSNTFNSTAGQYTDRPIWGNNIENGFGLFSCTTQSSKEFILD